LQGIEPQSKPEVSVKSEVCNAQWYYTQCKVTLQCFVRDTVTVILCILMMIIISGEIQHVLMSVNVCFRINVTVQLDTNKVRGFLFPAQAHLMWPPVSRSTRVRFPLTQIGNTSVIV